MIISDLRYSGNEITLLISLSTGQEENYIFPFLLDAQVVKGNVKSLPLCSFSDTYETAFLIFSGYWETNRHTKILLLFACEEMYCYIFHA